MGVWPELVERVAKLIQEATQRGIARRGLTRAAALYTATLVVRREPVMFRREPERPDLKSNEVVSNVDAMLALRAVDIPTLRREHLHDCLIAIQMLCQLAARDADDAMGLGLGSGKVCGTETSACLASAMTLSASDIFMHTLCDPTIRLNTPALSYAALGACLVTAGWFGISEIRRSKSQPFLRAWEVMTSQIAPFRHIPLRAVRTWCLPVLLMLQPRRRGHLKLQCMAVLTDVEHCHGHQRLALVTAPHASEALDFYAGSLEDKQAALSMELP